MEIDYRFCPTCAGPLETRVLKKGDPERLVCTRCGQVIYLDPKIAVGTIIRTGDDRLVMVRRAIEPGYGLWVFPGGYVDGARTSRRRPSARHGKKPASRWNSTSW